MDYSDRFRLGLTWTNRNNFGTICKTMFRLEIQLIKRPLGSSASIVECNFRLGLSWTNMNNLWFYLKQQLCNWTIHII